jgi:hypothetical protein
MPTFHGLHEVATLTTSLVGSKGKGALGATWADPSKLRTTVSLVIGSKMVEVCSSPCVFGCLLAYINVPYTFKTLRMSSAWDCHESVSLNAHKRTFLVQSVFTRRV